MVFDWIGLALAVFKLLNWITGKIDREQLKNDVRNELLADEAAIAFERTERGKKIMEKVNAMSDTDVDDEFDRLGRVRAPKPSKGN